MNVLSVQSSANGANSATRAIAQEFITALRKKHTAAAVVERDLTRNTPTMISPEVLGAMFTPVERHTAEHKSLLAVSDTAVAEVLKADVIVIGAPMYNFTVPACLKAWVDGVVRTGKTFAYTDKGPTGLIKPGKKVVLVIASGGKYTDGPMKTMDFVEPYMRSILGFIGLTDISVVRAEGLALGPDVADAAKGAAINAAKGLAAKI